MKLTIIVCVFNEINTIEKLINKILKVNLINDLKKEVLIIDNNSTDGTKMILNKYIEYENINIFFQQKNLGKGNSILKGIEESSGDYIVFQDADFEYEPENYNHLLNHLIANNLDAVFGSRLLKNQKYHIYRVNQFGTLIFTKMINVDISGFLIYRL